MPDLLLELRSEEIPARMQRKAAGDLKKLVTDALVDAGLIYDGAREYWTPRRLTLDLRGLTARSADLKEERKGPRTDAPEKAIEGFLRGAGLNSVDEAEIRTDPKKGEFLVAVINKPGRAAEEIIADAMPTIIQNFPWPKSMRWGEKSREAGSMKWVRPLQSIICTFGPETEEPVVVPFEVGGVKAGNVTYGHRFHAPDAITVRRFDDYVSALEKAKVVLDAERRKDIIKNDAKNLAFAKGLELVEDETLLEEVGNLVEWPVAIMGEFDEAFLDIPPEVIRLTIKENQKCFVLRKGALGDGSLSNNFLLVANIEATDGGKEIARGNAKVVNARLGDAKFFWETDLHTIKTDGFTPWLEKLNHVTFHAKLGTQGERVQRIMALAEELAPVVGADPAKAKRAAEICKADLNSAMVYEFPELQGLMGKRYAERAQKDGKPEDVSVALTAEEHWKPQGPSDDVPTDPVAVAVALTDKLDTLVGFWAIDEKPTGSKDPYALRRAALGVVRLIENSNLKISLFAIIKKIHAILLKQIFERTSPLFEGDNGDYKEDDELLETVWYQLDWYDGIYEDGFFYVEAGKDLFDEENIQQIFGFSEFAESLLFFFHDRLKVYLRDQGARHDLIDAVLSQGADVSQFSPLVGEMSAKQTEGGTSPALDQKNASTASPPLSSATTSPPQGGRMGASNDDLLMITRRVEALGSFLETDDGKNLLAGTKRAANILAAEEKKGTDIAGNVDADLFETDEERALFDSLEEAENFATQAIAKEDFAKAMEFLSQLRAPVDAFFENVMVNAEDTKVRANRLALMKRIRDATGTVADFSKIEG